MSKPESVTLVGSATVVNHGPGRQGTVHVIVEPSHEEWDSLNRFWGRKEATVTITLKDEPTP